MSIRLEEWAKKFDLGVDHSWFVFGENPKDGTVDIANIEQDVLENVPRGLAKFICDMHVALDALFEEVTKK